MKKILLSVFTVMGFMSSLLVNAQTWSVAQDTIYITASGGGAYYNDITSLSGSLDIKWNVTNCDFPADWKVDLGICDATLCRTNDGSGSLFNGGPFTTSGTPYAAGTPNTFDLVLPNSFSTASPGTHYISAYVKDNTTVGGGTNKTLTWVVTKFPVGVNKVTKATDDITLYPNPARSEVNVLYSPEAGIRTIAVYNLIGKSMNLFRVTNNSSAMLDLTNIPAGVYFLRFMDSNGQVVATRKFTHQQ